MRKEDGSLLPFPKPLFLSRRVEVLPTGEPITAAQTTSVGIPRCKRPDDHGLTVFLNGVTVFVASRFPLDPGRRYTRRSFIGVCGFIAFERSFLPLSGE